MGEITREHLNSWLSPARYERYLSTAGNDEAAFQLYLWNTGLAQATLRDISFFEVALRNAYAHQMDLWQESRGRNEHWLIDPASPLRAPISRTNKRGYGFDANRISRNTIDHLRSTLGPDADANDAIANLTFGFWAHMTDRSHERALWIPVLHCAWPAGTDRKSLHERISAINNIRNRAAHHEHLFGSDATVEACRDCVTLLAEIQPEVAQAIYGECLKSTVENYIAQSPAPCPVVM